MAKRTTRKRKKATPKPQQVVTPKWTSWYEAWTDPKSKDLRKYAQQGGLPRIGLEEQEFQKAMNLISKVNAIIEINTAK